MLITAYSCIEDHMAYTIKNGVMTLPCRSVCTSVPLICTMIVGADVLENFAGNNTCIVMYMDKLKSIMDIIITSF